VRPPVHALYGFVRGADEIVDGDGRAADPAVCRAALDGWEHELMAGLEAGCSDHPVIGALVDAGVRYELPLGELGAYMASMRVDCEPVRIETRRELETYMDGSGGSIGRIMASILGAPGEAEAFTRLGVAFQLTNFLRDVREDHRLGRIYLPADERERHGAGDADLGRDCATPGLRALVAEEVVQARQLFADSRAAVAAALRSARPAMRLARAVYLAVLDRIEAVDHDVLGAGTRPLPHQVARAVWAEARPR
jgi:15-cis-phytoene synthase